MLYFPAIKLNLDASDSDAAAEIMPVLAALLKQNLTIGIDACISMGFAEKSGVRAAFIGAVASVFKIPEAKVVGAEETSESSCFRL
jgi:hypothetical protein